jgi:hypothetical protein
MGPNVVTSRGQVRATQVQTHATPTAHLASEEQGEETSNIGGLDARAIVRNDYMLVDYIQDDQP